MFQSILKILLFPTSRNYPITYFIIFLLSVYAGPGMHGHCYVLEKHILHMMFINVTFLPPRVVEEFVIPHDLHFHYSLWVDFGARIENSTRKRDWEH